MSAGLVEEQDLDRFKGGVKWGAPTRGNKVQRRQEYKVCSKYIVQKGPVLESDSRY